ncbi:Potassium channel subfamily K member 12 [Xenoophorus captivus]|uniref:Potassium channel subfamily K member 12 n=1 Tax=Xenoophorus captivus TaxID=1517983 RepID=A0ABV0RSN9_9TELE
MRCSGIQRVTTTCRDSSSALLRSPNLKIQDFIEDRERIIFSRTHLQRLQGCRSLHLNEDNGRFVLLAFLILVYLLCGAAVFSAIERPSELSAHGRWNGTLLNFSETFNISLPELNSFLREYEAAIAAGIRADALRPRWDFTGAFYFVGTVVSTIGG